MTKGKVNIQQMQLDQCINWLAEILDNAALGSTDEAAMPEVFNRLKILISKLELTTKHQGDIIDFSLEKLTKKDVILITKRLI